MTEQKLRTLLLTLGILLFAGTRLLHLDADVPQPKLMIYSQTDEPYYAVSGFNWNSCGDYTDTRLPYCERDASTLLFTDSIFSAATMFLFGNNYYGFRLSAVLASVLILLLLLRAFRGMKTQLQPAESPLQRWFPVFAVFYLALDPAFLTASRLHEPGIFRALYIVAVLALFVYREKFYARNNWSFPVTVGFIAMCSVLLGYPHNAFLVAAAGTAVLVLGWDKKRLGFTFMQCVFFGAGLVAGAGLFLLLNKILTGMGLSDMLGFLDTSADQRMQSGQNAGLLARLRSMFIFTFSSNIFRLNPGLLLLVLLSLPLLALRLRKPGSRPADVFVVLLCGWWFLQTFFENTYPEKRHVIMLPVFLFLIYRALEAIRVVHFSSKYVYWGLFAAAALFTLIIIRGMKVSVLPDVPGAQKYWVTGVLGFTMLAATVMVRLIGKTKLNSKIAVLPAIALLFSGSLFTVKEVVGATFQYRDGMKALQAEVGKEKMAGGIAMGVRLYGEGDVFLNSYPWYYNVPEYTHRMNELFTKHGCMYTVLYPADKKANYIHSAKWLQDKNLEVKFDSVKTFDLGDRKVILFRKASATN